MRNRSYYDQPALSIDGLRRMVPSAFATQAHESRSSRYTYIPTVTVIEGLMQNDFLPFSASQSLARTPDKQPYAKHMITFRHASKLEKVGDKAPEVVIVNAHDGSSTFDLFLGVYVKVCANGLIVSGDNAKYVSVSHRGNVVDKVIEGSFEVIDESYKALEAGKRWGQLMLTGSEQRLYADIAHEIRFGAPEIDGNTGRPIPHPVQPHQLLTARRYDDNGNSLWDTFNRVQENTVRGGLEGVRTDRSVRSGVRRISTRPVKGIDQNVALNRSLWKLTEKFAELKTGAAA
jgi:Domain of unknown function (DUF932)